MEGEPMSSHEVHEAGISLEQIVSRLHAKLRGSGASNTADYYDYSKGLYDGVASALEALQATLRPNPAAVAGSTDARLGVFLSRAIRALRAVDPSKEDPDKIPNVATALVEMVG